MIAVEGLTQKLISFRTTKDNLNQIKGCLNFIKNILISSGHVKAEIVDTPNGKPFLLAIPKEAKKSKIIFCGHIDVVPANQTQFRAVVKKGKIFGRGAFDMKGPLSSLIVTFLNLSSQNQSLPLTLFISSDEEIGGWKGANLALNNGVLKGKVAILPDGGVNFDIVIRQKGPLHLKVIFKGKSCHAAESSLKLNPIIKLSHFLSDIQNQSSNLERKKIFGTTIIPTKVSGGEFLNQTPNSITVDFDIRLSTPSRTDKIFRDFLNICKKHKTNVEFSNKKDLIFQIPPDDMILNIWKKCVETILNKKVRLTETATASDGRFFAARGISAIITAPVGGGRHSESEWVDIRSLENLEKILREFILNKQLIQII